VPDAHQHCSPAVLWNVIGGHCTVLLHCRPLQACGACKQCWSEMDGRQQAQHWLTTAVQAANMTVCRQSAVACMCDAALQHIHAYTLATHQKLYRDDISCAVAVACIPLTSCTSLLVSSRFRRSHLQVQTQLMYSRRAVAHGGVCGAGRYCHPCCAAACYKYRRGFGMLLQNSQQAWTHLNE
jgi:hypothetical protein